MLFQTTKIILSIKPISHHTNTLAFFENLIKISLCVFIWIKDYKVLNKAGAGVKPCGMAQSLFFRWIFSYWLNYGYFIQISRSRIHALLLSCSPNLSFSHVNPKAHILVEKISKVKRDDTHSILPVQCSIPKY